MLVQGLDADARHDQRGAGAARAGRMAPNREAQGNRRARLIRGRGPRLAPMRVSVPWLSNAGFILKPDFDRPAGKLPRDRGAGQPGEVFFKSLLPSRSLCGCRGRTDMLLKFSFFSSLPTLRSC